MRRALDVRATGPSAPAFPSSGTTALPTIGGGGKNTPVRRRPDRDPGHSHLSRARRASPPGPQHARPLLGENAIGKTAPLQGLWGGHEHEWRVSTVSASPRYILENYSGPLGSVDLQYFTKGGFVLGFWGVEGPIRQFAQALHTLPAGRVPERCRPLRSGGRALCAGRGPAVLLRGEPFPSSGGVPIADGRERTPARPRFRRTAAGRSPGGPTEPIPVAKLPRGKADCCGVRAATNESMRRFPPNLPRKFNNSEPGWQRLDQASTSPIASTARAGHGRSPRPSNSIGPSFTTSFRNAGPANWTDSAGAERSERRGVRR